MFNKNLRAGLAAVAAGLMLTGCGAPAVADETVTVEDTTPVTIVESVATVSATEPAGERFAFGQEVWSIRRSSDGGDAYLVRYAVVAQAGDIVAVVPMFTADVDELRETLIETAQMPLDGTGHLYLVLADNCYLDPEEAQAAADEENG